MNQVLAALFTASMILATFGKASAFSEVDIPMAGLAMDVQPEQLSCFGDGGRLAAGQCYNAEGYPTEMETLGWVTTIVVIGAGVAACEGTKCLRDGKRRTVESGPETEPAPTVVDPPAKKDPGGPSLSPAVGMP